MREREMAVKVFLLERLTELGCGYDEMLLDKVVSTIHIEEGMPDEHNETRAVTVDESKDGNLTAKSVKPYNLLRMSLYDFMGVLLGGAGVALASGSTVGMAQAVLSLIYGYYPKLTYEFSEQDATRVLVAINEFRNKEFSNKEIGYTYQKLFNSELEDERLVSSLKVLRDVKVIEAVEGDRFKLRERLTVNRY